MKKKILLVEDDVSVCDLYEHVLISAGYDVISAEDGDKALKLIKDKPDLILLDIMLPKIDGIEVLKRFKASEDARSIPVIMLTNLGQESIVQEALRIGARDYQVKSQVDPYDLVKKIALVVAPESGDPA